jgi:hypothetical protein
MQDKHKVVLESSCFFFHLPSFQPDFRDADLQQIEINEAEALGN